MAMAMAMAKSSGGRISGISSMATRLLLAELGAAYQRHSGVAVEFEAAGGVDAAKRVQAGEAFDLVVLASEAIDKLAVGASVIAASKTDLLRSTVAVAVRAGAPRPQIGSEEALRRAVLACASIGYSTGPSGVALLQLFERWGIAAELQPRIVQAPAGVPVGELVAAGRVELGFQQLSELTHLAGIEVLGPMPAGCEIVTTFAAAICTTSTQPQAVRSLLDFLRSPACDAAKRRQGMAPA